MFQRIQKTVSAPQVQYTDRALHKVTTLSPREFRRQCWRHRRRTSTNRWTSQLCNREEVLHSAQTPQVQFLNKVVDMPVVVRRQVRMLQTVLQTVEEQQLQFIDQVIELPVMTQRQIPTV